MRESTPTAKESSTAGSVCADRFGSVDLSELSKTLRAVLIFRHSQRKPVSLCKDFLTGTGFFSFFSRKNIPEWGSTLV